MLRILGKINFIGYLIILTIGKLYSQENDSNSIVLPFPFKDESYSPLSNPKEGGLYLSTPSNIKSDVQYDPKTERYIFEQKIGSNIDYRSPASLSLDEYLEYDMQKSLKRFFAEKQAEELEEKSGDDASKFKPQIKVENEIFDRIFGTSTIDIKPQGSAEVILGVQSSRTRNPAIPLKQQSLTTFLFDQKIQLNVLGQIGDKMKLNLNFNTEAMFNFENITKLSYAGKEDDILQLLEAGNVSMPLKTTLITGSQTLFGLKTGLKFGKLRVTTILSQQQGKKQEIEVKNGAQIKPFEVKADEYEFNRHFFLDHFFRDQFEKAVGSPPIINSEIYVTKIEVYKTPLNVFENTRNIIALQDLGTANSNKFFNKTFVVDNNPASNIASNDANNLYAIFSKNSNIRGFVSAVSELKKNGLQDRRDFFTIAQSQMLTEGKDYTLNRQLGYISLNQELPVDFALAVAFQFTYRGKTYQVGEFSTDGYAGQDALILKMLKSVELDVRAPMWDLMMKNIYNLGNAYQVKKEGFILDVWYLDQNTGVKINYIPEGSVKNRSIIQLLGLDKLSVNNQPVPGGDGIFDFLDNPPLTIMPANGRVIFTKLEPFGSGLRSAFSPDEISVANKYTFDSLYTNTQAIARVNFPQRNRFYIKGQYESANSSEISLGAFNIPQGAVRVTQGGNVLVENIHYTVDYNLGRVKIIDAGVMQSATPIKISLESNSLFSVVQRSLIGTRFDYDVNRNLTLGGTWMRMSERPVTQKVTLGDEPFINNMLGFDMQYNQESKFITTMLNRLPFINSKNKAKINFMGEYATLLPGHPKRVIGQTGTAYIDDFEGSQSTIELRGVNNWRIASTPQGQRNLFPEGELTNNIANAYNRAKLAWYTIDPSVFYRTTSFTPQHISDDKEMLSNHFMRVVYENGVFPNRQLNPTQPQNIAMFDLAYYPSERGPYNYDVDGRDENGVKYASGINPDGTLANPEERWAGIMREIHTNDFDAANVEFIQFWLMDPYAEAGNPGFPDFSNSGELFFNIGNISEDVMRDDQVFFENGLGTSEAEASDLSGDAFSPWGRVIPANIPYLVNAFDNDPNTRSFQDVGLDGLRNQEEQRYFKEAYLDKIANLFGTASQAYLSASNDPSSDDYNYYLDDDFDTQELNILQRYKKFNGLEGNSPTSEQYASQNAAGYPTTASTLPNSEDINNDRTINFGESYYQYRVKINPSEVAESNVGRNYIYSVYEENYTGVDGVTKPVKWYQFRIPVRDINRESINGMNNLNSIRFMRIFMKGFKDPVFLRFARLELVRGEWRKYLGNTKVPGEYIDNDQYNNFSIAAVNIEENGSVDISQNTLGVSYVIPPDIERQINLNTVNQQLLNEQAIALNSCGLADGNFNGAYRNVNFDVRMYKRLQMFVHGQSADKDNLLKDDELKVFIRLGTDFENNYYEYELPLKITPPGNYINDDRNARLIVWPEANNMDIEFAQLQKAKTQRNQSIGNNFQLLQQPYSIPDPNYPNNTITIVGNPNLSTLKSVMIGVKNPKDDGIEKCVQVWVNELRLTDFNDDAGWAALGRLVADLPGLGTLSVAGAMSTPGFGSIDKRVAERQLETIQQFDISFSTDLGQFMPNTNLKIPTYVGYSQNLIKPRFNPLDPDVELKNLLQTPDANKTFIDSLMTVTNDLTINRSLNFTNVRKEKGKDKKVSLPWDISNFTTSFAYQETYRRNFNLTLDLTKRYTGNLTYAYSFNTKPIEPFKKLIKSKSKYWMLIKDFNLYYLPKQIGFSTDLERFYNERITRNNNPGITAELPPFYNKTFNWKRFYDLKWDISKSLKLDFNASNIALIEEPYGQVNKKQNKEAYMFWRDSVFKSMSMGGTTMDYRHQANLNWSIPLNKFPLLDWINATARYSGSYNWMRAPFAADSLGHTIQNSNSKQLNVNMNFVNLYNKVPYLKKVTQKFNAPKKDNKQDARKNMLEKKVNKAIENVLDTTLAKKKEKKEKEEKITFLDHTLRVLMGIKNASVTYSQDNGLLLPGYGQKTSLLGMNSGFTAPGIPFLFGLHEYFGESKNKKFAPYAASKGWMVQGVNITTMHTTTQTEQINFRSSVEPIKDFRVDLTANYTYGFNTSEFFNWNDSLPGGPGYQSQSYTETGNFSKSFNTFATAFARIDSNYNTLINNRFLINRTIISERMANERAGSISNYLNGLHPSDSGYKEGFGSTNQDVLIPAFIAAYTGKDPSKTTLNPIRSLPNINWRVTYTGLNKLEVIKKKVKSVSITHGYKSTLTMGTFTSNMLFFDNLQTAPNGVEFADTLDANSNFIPRYQINTIVISEQLSPLINIDVTMKNNMQVRFEIKKDRNITLSIPNTQVTEINGMEYIVGTGYIIPKVKFPFKIAGSSKKIESNLNLRVDFSIRDNKTILRKIIEGTNVASAGQKIYSLKAAADYRLTEKLNLRYFLDWISTTPFISTSFPTSNFSSGISVRFTL